MKQLTLRQIPAEVENELRQVAGQNGASLNHTAIAALQKGLGLAPPARRRRDLSRFAGKWTAEEAAEFEQHVQAFSHIDEELWRGVLDPGHGPSQPVLDGVERLAVAADQDRAL